MFKYLNARLYGLKIMSNSIPKSGTHLLERVFKYVPQIYDRQSDTKVHGEFPFHEGWCDKLRSFFTEEELDAAMRRVRRGQYIVAHMKYRADIEVMLRKYNYKHILIVRDPRDVAVSWTHFATTGMNNANPMMPFYKKFPDDSTRLIQTMLGFEMATEWGTFRVPSIRQLYDDYKPWLDKADCCVVRYECLIGKSGGGTHNEQYSEIEKILRYLEVHVSDELIERVAQNLYSVHSPTFRKGRISDWKTEFSAEHRAIFKDVSGSILLDWGYEKDLNW